MQIQTTFDELEGNDHEMERRQKEIQPLEILLYEETQKMFFNRHSYTSSEAYAQQQKIDSLKDQLQQLNQLRVLPLTKRVVLNFDGYTYDMTLEHPNKILFYNHSQELECINIYIHKSEIELRNYYFYTSKTRCPNIPHVRFFNFLKLLGVLYRKNIILTDASSKKIDYTDCNLYACLFSLAGLPTFYEHFGFVNEAYSRVIQETKRITFVQFLQRARYQKDKEYARALEVLRGMGLNEHSYVTNIAKHIINKCKKTSVRNSRSVTSSRSGLSRKTSSYSTSSTKDVQWLAEFMAKLFNSMTQFLPVSQFRLTTANP